MAKQPGARKDSSYTVISMAPSVNKTQVGNAVVPVPYPVTIDLSNNANFSDNVNFNSDAVLRFNSDTTKVTGDEAGKLGGVKSGTTSAKAEPKDKSASVKINGQWLIRCQDMFWMNNQNTMGRLICAPPPPQGAIQDDGKIDPPDVNEAEKSEFEQAWDRARELVDDAEQAIDEGVKDAQALNEKYALVTRIEGGVQGVFGVIEVVGGAIGVLAPEPLSSAGGVLLVANGVDNTQSGFRQLWSGNTTQSAVETGVQKGAQLIGLDPALAELAVAGAGMLSNPSKILTKGDDAIEAVADLNKAQRKADKLEDSAASKPKKDPDGADKKDPEGPEKKDSDDGGQVKGKKLPKTNVPCFDKDATQANKDKGAEFDRQLKGQQDAINDMSADDYLKGRGAFLGKDVCNGSKTTKISRDPKKAKEAREDETLRLKELKEKELIADPAFSKKTKAEVTALALADAKHQMSKLAALHNPDMIAGGADVLSGSFGDQGINSAIGGSWRTRIGAMDASACKARKEGQGKHKMNVDLHRCNNSKKVGRK